MTQAAAGPPPVEPAASGNRHPKRLKLKGGSVSSSNTMDVEGDGKQSTSVSALSGTDGTTTTTTTITNATSGTGEGKLLIVVLFSQ